LPNGRTGWLQRHMRRMYGADPGNADYTSIVSDRHYARLEGLVADAAARGAKVIQTAKPDDPAVEIEAKISADHHRRRNP
jgi:coniferyl-aldehyde dehydrogenase